MLAAKDGERRSYLEIATALRRHGADTRRDLRELWRRIVFTVLVSNVDDHLRNHAFLYTGPEGWELSPAYDLNPTPIDIKSRVLSTSITADDDTASLELALSVARHFDLDLPAARAIAHEVGTVVGAWRAIGRRVGLKSAQLDRMESAFDHEDLRAAQCAPVAVAGNIPAVPHR
jgi:serine/threonine-protein kinase HipA